jgi:hypothetical protein
VLGFLAGVLIQYIDVLTLGTASQVILCTVSKQYFICISDVVTA